MIDWRLHTKSASSASGLKEDLSENHPTDQQKQAAGERGGRADAMGSNSSGSLHKAV